MSASDKAVAESELHRLSVCDIAERVADGRLSARDIASAFLSRIERLDSLVHAYLHVDAQGALEQADAVDRARAAGESLGALCGVPIALKDNLCTRGVPTTCASRVLAGYEPPYDAHVVERLRAAGAVLLGKLNLDEFAMGSSTEGSAFGPTRNPWNLRYSPGGSSGGPATATALGLAAATLGSDTGGSVRQPAAFCGVTGLKPTYGRVSRYGLVAFASSLDQIGPICGSARDAARLLSAIAGHDPRDATSAPRQVDDYEGECGRELAGLRIGVLRDGLEDCDVVVREAFESSLSRLERLGCQLGDVRLPNAEHAVSAYYILAPAEASSNLSRFDGMRYGQRVTGVDLADTYRKTRSQGFGAEVKRRIMLGTYALSAGYYDAFYLKAQRVRTLIARDYEQAFSSCDVVLSPVAPKPAFAIGADLDPIAIYKQDLFTLPPSLAGICAISTPCGFSDDGLPIGLQAAAPQFHEGRLLRLADAFEREMGARRFPPDPGQGAGQR